MPSISLVLKPAMVFYKETEKDSISTDVQRTGREKSSAESMSVTKLMMYGKGPRSFRLKSMIRTTQQHSLHWAEQPRQIMKLFISCQTEPREEAALISGIQYGITIKTYIVK